MSEREDDESVVVSPSPSLEPPDEPLDLLAVAAHPDDAELSVGGILAKAASEGLRVGVLDLTDGEPTPKGDPATRAAETAAASAALGLTWRGQLGLPNRSLVNDIAARRRLAEAIRRLRPRVLLGHVAEDVHPDHVAASALVDGARFWSKLSRSDMAGDPFWPRQVYQFWSIHLRQPASPSVVIDVSDSIDAKMAAVECYQSQLGLGEDRPFPNVSDDVRARSRYWGWAIQAAYGEPLLSRETMRLGSVRTLLDEWA